MDRARISERGVASGHDRLIKYSHWEIAWLRNVAYACYHKVGKARWVVQDNNHTQYS